MSAPQTALATNKKGHSVSSKKSPKDTHSGQNSEAPTGSDKMRQDKSHTLGATGFPTQKAVALFNSPCGSSSTTVRQGSGTFSGEHSPVPLAWGDLPHQKSAWTLGGLEPLAVRRRRLAAEREAAQEEAERRARPDGVNALGHDADTQRRLGLEVLQAAFTQVSTEAGVVRHPREYCLAAGEGGIVAAGGEPPPWPRHIRLRPKRKTGQKVSDGRPSPEEVSRRRALIAAAAEKLRALLVFLPLVAGE